ncbi:23S rRNA methyltransferase attenuation leader peptide, partial [Streptococcus suis]|nr:23S rRNA methyltransferase attenuation leader peptide [Streptococcus suis]MBO4132190.1 23S rRNA methyltransferase attenuation leader peptide [Streptococcus suis]NQP71190.1 23S rRNA methyltransferase attenuation leader peptide [Streptococcus suis]NQP71922.1 23S rRNA methyltransferase attenuation leader peptide [Streptococcus suis]NQP72312.1 23S rRNA methyltransferase attenuation leader peptide [Streptococcus suis]
MLVFKMRNVDKTSTVL